MGLLDEHRDRLNNESINNSDGNENGRDQDKHLNFKLLLIISAIFCGNIASGYTTLWGVDKVVDSIFIATLMTITIQGVMTATALIATTKKIQHKSSFVLIYIIPMLVSMSFNYVFFHSKFSNVSLELNKSHDEKVKLNIKKQELLKYLTKISKEIHDNYIVTKNDLKIKIKDNSEKKNLELTKYGTGGSGKGKYFTKYENNVSYYSDLLSNLEKDNKKIKEKEEIARNKLLASSNFEDLKGSYSEIIGYRNFSIQYIDSIDVSDTPYLGENKELTKGEGNTVYDAINSLKSPNLFEIIAIILAILMDFIIFIWVVVSMIFGITIKEFVHE